MTRRARAHAHELVCTDSEKARQTRSLRESKPASEREREAETEKDSQTDRQTDRAPDGEGGASGGARWRGAGEGQTRPSSLSLHLHRASHARASDIWFLWHDTSHVLAFVSIGGCRTDHERGIHSSCDQVEVMTWQIVRGGKELVATV